MPLPTYLMYAPEYLLKLNDMLSRRIKPTRPSFFLSLKNIVVITRQPRVALSL